jgi:hypothetical protein
MDSIDQFFDFIKRGEHALVNLNPHFVLVPTYPRMMPLFVHAVYRGDNFYTHALLPYSQIPLPAYLWCENTLCNRTEVLGYLMVSTPSAARAPARKSSSVTGTMPTATGFLRTRFVDLERTAFDTQAVEFSNGLCRVIFRPEFHESVTARAARLPLGDNAGRDRLIALPYKQLQQALIGNAVRQTSYVKLCHMLSSVLTGSTARYTQKPAGLAGTPRSMLCCLCA